MGPDAADRAAEADVGDPSVRAADGVDPPGISSVLPQLGLDQLLAELQARTQAVLATRDRERGLLDAVVAIGSGLDLQTMLHRITEAAVALTGARYGALGVVGPEAGLAEFVPVGLDVAEIARIERWPEGRGVLGLLIRDPRPLRLPDVGQHPQSSGFPAGHPPMRSFLGAPIRIRGEVFGNLYLTEKAGAAEFTADDEAVVSALGMAAGVAIENARLYEEARRQQRWLQASAEATTSLLSGTDPHDVLAAVTRQALQLSGADLAVLGLPEDDGARLVIEYAEGDGAEAVRGLVLDGRGSLSGRVLASGEPLSVDDFATDGRTAETVRVPMGHLGRAYVFPLGVPGNVHGVLTVGRRHGAPSFPPAVTEVVASFATQAGVALELADRRRGAEQLSLYEDRDRIARDLHDQVIQRLYATGMSLQAAVPMIDAPQLAGRVRLAVDDMDQTIAEIRSAIFALNTRDDDKPPSLRSQIVAVTDELTPMFGFTPEVRLGAGLDDDLAEEPARQMLIALREALSNAARHAHASRVEVAVEARGDLVLRVRDNGVGIGPDAGRSGLANLAERAVRLGGALRVGFGDTAAGTGTDLEWRAPVRDNQR